jgi:polar amino acid transport system ATP-binding protein
MLTIKNLSKQFHGQKILDDVSLTVNNGEIALLLGQSGVGKSTLLRILNNLEIPDSGRVLIDGKTVDLTTVNKEHSIGMIFQQFNLFEHLTVEQNITLPLELVVKKSKKEAHEIAQNLLKQFGLATKADALIAQLSGGQKQRLAIARALAMNPKVLCADEPTSALDPQLKHFVAKNIQQLADQGFTVLVASHDIALLSLLQCTIYLMKAGKIVESAKSKDFNANKSAYPRINAFVTSSSE